MGWLQAKALTAEEKTDMPKDYRLRKRRLHSFHQELPSRAVCGCESRRSAVLVNRDPLVGRGVVEGLRLSGLRSRRLHGQVSVQPLSARGQ